MSAAGTPLLLVSIRINGIRGKLRENFIPSFQVSLPNKFRAFDYKEEVKRLEPINQDQESVTLFGFALLAGDIRISFSNESKPSSTEYEFADIFFNTNMIGNNLTLKFLKHEIDGPHKDVKSKRFPNDFSIEVILQNPESDEFKKVPATYLFSSPSSKTC